MRAFRFIFFAAVFAVALCGPGLAEYDHSGTESSHSYSYQHRWYLPATIFIKGQSNRGKNSNQIGQNGEDNSTQSPNAWVFKPEWMIVWVTGIYTIVSTIALILVIVQIHHARVASRRQLRAYIVPEKGSITNVANVVPDPPELEQHARVLNPKIGPLASIGIKNAGQSPSYDVRHTTTIYIRAYTNPPAILTKVPSDGDPSVMILGPGIGSTMDVWLHDALTTLEVDNLKAGLAVIYVVGEIAYTDIFGKSHTTRYKMEHHSTHGKIGWNTNLVFSPNGNYGD